MLQGLLSMTFQHKVGAAALLGAINCSANTQRVVTFATYTWLLSRICAVFVLAKDVPVLKLIKSRLPFFIQKPPPTSNGTTHNDVWLYVKPTVLQQGFLLMQDVRHMLRGRLTCITADITLKIRQGEQHCF
jgi:hypothetical protein